MQTPPCSQKVFADYGVRANGEQHAGCGIFSATVREPASEARRNLTIQIHFPVYILIYTIFSAFLADSVEQFEFKLIGSKKMFSSKKRFLAKLLPELLGRSTSSRRRLDLKIFPFGSFGFFEHIYGVLF